MTEARGSHARIVYALLLVLATLYLVAELKLNRSDRFFDYDEAIYISQSAPSMQPAHWAAHRSRGMAWLVAPVAGSGASLPEIRLYLMVLSAILLCSGFALWIPLVGEAAPVAAWLFGGTWLALFYGAEAMPNHFSALFALIAVAAYLRRPGGGKAAWGAVAVLAMTAMTLLRPTDASSVLAGLVAWQLVSSRGRHWRDLLPLTAGVVLGWSPWLWEAETRFGGIAERFHRAAELAGGFGVSILDHLRAADGPLLGGDRVISAGALLWWTGLIALSAYGAVRASRRQAAASGALIAGLAATLTYFFLTRDYQDGTLAPIIAPRFLSPAYALLSIPAAVGCVSLIQKARRAGRVAATVVIGTLLIGIGSWQLWQWNVADRIARREFQLRESSRIAATAIRELRDDRGCLLISQFPEPQIQSPSGCGRALRKPYVFRRPGGLRDLARPDIQRFALVYPPPYPDQALAMRGWRVLRPQGGRNLLLFVEPESSVISDPAPLESPPANAPPVPDRPDPPGGH